MKPGLAEQKNAVVVPHIASASKVRTQRDRINIYIAVFFVLNLVLATNPTFSSSVQWTREGMATLAALNVLVSSIHLKYIYSFFLFDQINVVASSVHLKCIFFLHN